MGATQVAAIIYAIICLTFGGKLMAPEPVYNVPPPPASEIHITLEGNDVTKEVVRKIVIKQDPLPVRVEPAKPSLVGPALLVTIAVLVFGNGG